MSTVTASALRANIHRILDDVIETGAPVEIVRRGKKLRIVLDADESVDPLENLVERHDVIAGDPEDLVHLDWSKEWRRDPI